MSPKDERWYWPESADEIEAEFTRWKVYQLAGRWHADGEGTAVHGDDLSEIRDKIIAWKWRHGPYHDGDDTVTGLLPDEAMSGVVLVLPDRNSIA